MWGNVTWSLCMRNEQVILIYGNVAWLLVVNFYYGVPSQLALSSHLLQLEKFTFLGVQKIKRNSLTLCLPGFPEVFQTFTKFAKW